MHGDKSEQVAARNCVLVHLVIWKNVCVSECVRIYAKSHFLTIYHFCWLFVKKSVRYISNNNTGSARNEHYSFCTFAKTMQTTAHWKTSGAYHEIFSIHVLDEEMFAAAADAGASGCNCFTQLQNKNKTKNTEHQKRENKTIYNDRHTHTVTHTHTYIL